VTTEEQEKMRQSIEKKQETKAAPNSVTGMFHCSKGFFGASDSFLARVHAALSLSETLTGDVFVPAAAPSLLAHLKVPIPRAHPRRRTRRRTMPSINKFYAEGPIARSALAVLAANPNPRSQVAAATPITIMIEQRRCAAA